MYADRGMPPPEPPQGDTRWAGGIGVLQGLIVDPRYSPYRLVGVRHNGRGKRSAAPGSV